MDKNYNTKRTAKDTFGVRRPSQQERVEADVWSGLEPNLGVTFAQIATTTAMVEGVLTMQFLEHAEIVPRPFVELAVTNAIGLGWLQEDADGEYTSRYVPNDLADLVHLAEESDSSIHEIAAEICFELIEELMTDNPMKMFCKKDALIGLGGPCTAKTWPLVERMLSQHPSIMVGNVRNHHSSRLESKLKTGSGNFYRSIFDVKEVARRDNY